MLMCRPRLRFVSGRCGNGRSIDALDVMNEQHVLGDEVPAGADVAGGVGLSGPCVREVLTHALVHRSENGVTRAVVAPAWGAAVVALSVQETDWSWPVPVLEAVDLATMAAKPTSYGIPLLAPVPGRTGRDQSGRCTYRGEEYRLVPTRHGFLRDLVVRDIASLQDLLTGVSAEAMAEAATLLEQGGVVYLIGQLRSAPVVDLLRYVLTMLGKRCVAVPLAPGGLLVFDGLIPHGTPRNNTDRRRRALQFHYAPASAQRTSQEARMAIFGSEGKNVSC